MNETVRIDCEVCADLFPLVEDGVACEQSREAVKKHLAECEMCRERYGNALLAAQPVSGQEQEKDDARIVSTVRERVSGWLLAAMMISLLLGILLTTASGAEPWPMVLIFPAICAGVYLRGGRLWKWVPPAAMGLWVTATLLMSGGRLMDIPLAFVLGVIPLGLSYIGALAAALLKYAVKGEF